VTHAPAAIEALRARLLADGCTAAYVREIFKLKERDAQELLSRLGAVKGTNGSGRYRIPNREARMRSQRMWERAEQR
jgi:hypothetical protein